MSPRKEELSGARRSALLLLAMPQDIAAQVMSFLPEEAVMDIATEIAALKYVSPGMTEGVVEEFAKVWERRRGTISGGLRKVEALLEVAAPDRAQQIVSGIDRRVIDPPFSWVYKVDTQVMCRTLQSERPITCAVVLSFLSADHAASIMLGLSPELRTATAVAIASLDDPEHELVEAVEAGIKEQLGPNVFERQYRVGGVDSLVSLLNRADRETETKVLEALGAIDEHLATEVKRRLFLFEDIATLDQRSIQKILASVDMSKMPTAMKGISEETSKTLLENMSERAAEVLREEIEILGPVRLADVNSAQAEVVAVVNRLDAEGEITINRGSDALVN